MTKHYDKELIKDKFSYDPSQEKFILGRAQELIGRSIQEIIKISPTEQKSDGNLKIDI